MELEAEWVGEEQSTPLSELPACPSPSFHSPHARLASSSTSSRNAVEESTGRACTERDRESVRERSEAGRTRTHVTSRLCVRVGVLISARVCVCASPGRRSLSLSHSLVPHCTVRPPSIVVGYVLCGFLSTCCTDFFLGFQVFIQFFVENKNHFLPLDPVLLRLPNPTFKADSLTDLIL